MKDVDFALDVLIDQVERAGGDPDADYVVFGSTVLWLHGIRDAVGDVDVFVRRPVWDRWKADGWRVLAPREGDPAFLELDCAPPIHAFYSWPERDEWMDVERCFALAERFMGVRCVPVEEVARHKAEAFAHSRDDAAHAKHLADLRLIGGS